MRCDVCGKDCDWLLCTRCTSNRETQAYWRDHGIIMDSSCGLDSRYCGTHPRSLELIVWEYRDE